MLIRSTDLPEPPAGEPFKYDRLGRVDYAKPLTQLIENTPEPFVLAVDGGWGTGKTSFLRMWCRYLEDRGHRCLYFSAWKNDFAVDPLAALVAELAADLEKDSPLSDRTKKVLAELKKVANVLSRRFAGAAIATSLYSLWSSRSPNEPDEQQQALENFSNAAGEVVSDAVGNYLAGRRDLEKFRAALSKLVAELAESDRGDSPKKVVLFVDELDRCRPLYAVELLERIKHLFDVPGVIFALGLNLEQLAHSVKAVNGTTFDGVGYLRRFLDLIWSLPEPSAVSLRQLPIWEEAKLFAGPKFHLETLEREVTLLSAALNFGLRTQAQLLSQVVLAMRAVEGRSREFVSLLAFTVFVREWRPRLFADHLGKPDNAEEMAASLLAHLKSVDAPPENFSLFERDLSARDRLEALAIGTALAFGRKTEGFRMLESQCKTLTEYAGKAEADAKMGMVNSVKSIWENDSDRIKVALSLSLNRGRSF